jgi:hypothetical protein
LLKWVHFREDSEGIRAELRYFRDIEGREVDFVVTENDQPTMFVECKTSDRDVSSELKYLKSKFPNTEAWQVSASGKADFVTREGVRVSPALKLLAKLV